MSVKTKAQFKQLVHEAIELGATSADVIPPTDIVVRDELARLCDGNPRCEQYGLAPSCPPHVAGPTVLRQIIQNSAAAIVVRIDVPTAALFSDQRRDIMALLHEIVAGVEIKAIAMGYRESKAFAGGSCKKIFCYDQPDCRVLTARKPCRHPQSARPSMSGYGIDVARLMISCGWPANAAAAVDASDKQSMSWVAGLILVAAAADRSAGAGSARA